MEQVNVVKVSFGSSPRTGSAAQRARSRRTPRHGDETRSADNAARPLRLAAVNDRDADSGVAGQRCGDGDDDLGGEVLAW